MESLKSLNAGLAIVNTQQERVASLMLFFYILKFELVFDCFN